MINVRIADLKRRYRARKFTYYATTVLAGLALALIWLGQTRALATALGIIGTGVTLAMSQSLLNIAGRLLIMIRRPFDIGDRIELGGVRGDVIDIHLFQILIMEIGNWMEWRPSSPWRGSSTAPTARSSAGRSTITSGGPSSSGTRSRSSWPSRAIGSGPVEELLLQCAIEEGEQEKIQAEPTRDLDRLAQRHLIFPYRALNPYLFVRIKDSKGRPPRDMRANLSHR